MDIEIIYNAGVKAAYRAGKILTAHYGNISAVGKKGAVDLVTEADVASEKAVIGIIRAAFPGHAILAEESGLNQGDEAFTWIIDPLDGTTNFAHRLGLFSVSIAFAENNEPRFGVVLNPLSGELYTAVKGSGAFLNGRPIRVSGASGVSDSLLVTGFPYNVAEIWEEITARFSSCLRAARGVRRLGSAAIDLCKLAEGVFDGFWEQGLKPWDTAAGVLIAREAGARVTDFSDREFHIDKTELLATNGNIHQQMLQLLNTGKDDA